MEYSVIIRTIGKAGEKYQKLLDSIAASNIQPREIIVVIPNGYELPKEQLGIETFIFCEKGMVNQRLVGINNCKTQYALIVDDDIAFGPDFIEKVSEPVVSGEYGLSSGPLIEFFPPKGVHSIISAVSGSAMPTLFHKERYNTVLKTTGYSYNRNLVFNDNRLYETQSAAWTCFFADINKLKNIHFDDELWLDSHRYSTHDDTAMFYKSWLLGNKCVIVADAQYQHLDAGTSKINNKSEREFASGFNTFVFWKRFIVEPSYGASKVAAYICFSYFLCFLWVESLLKSVISKNERKDRKAYFEGVFEAKKWIRSDEYKSIKKIKD